MIKVEISYKGKGFQSLLVKGHAGTAEHGKDLVCAAVSAITVGAMNALENTDEDFEIEIEEGRVSCTALGSVSDHDETVIETLIIQLKTIEVSYPNAIDIKERKK
ncbi:MAG: ribosomal-processing cysteine protease Prp [Bacilli bacterium]|nr:ribosomal-processing cysteine protease Prp [Bacilli bacterium]